MSENLFNAKLVSPAIYLIRFDNGCFYVGSTSDIQNRMQAHVRRLGFNAGDKRLRGVLGRKNNVQFKILSIEANEDVRIEMEYSLIYLLTCSKIINKSKTNKSMKKASVSRMIANVNKYLRA